MKYVGIKSCYQKKKAIRKALKEKRAITVKVEDLVAKDCVRHLEMLKCFDDRILFGRYTQTFYYQYQRSNDRTHAQVYEKINKFKAVYKRIMQNGYNYHKGYMIVSDNGVRLDGSHRASILYHLKTQKIDVLETTMPVTSELMQHIEDQRHAYC